MKLTAVLLDYPPQRWIGSELATHALLKHFQRRGYDVRVYSHSARGPYVYDGIQVVPRSEPLIGEHAILTHAYMSPVLLAPVAEARQRARTPIVVIAHNARDYTLRAIHELEPDIVAANCWTTARALGVSLEHVVRPPLELPAGRAGVAAAVTDAVSRADMVGFVNSAPVKGGAVLKELVYRHGPYRVLGVTGGYGDQQVMTGVQIPQSEMAESYFQKIKIHVQPSIEESWGMLNLEALSHGCALVTTALPGIQEALYKVPDRWIKWISPDITRAQLDDAICDMLEQHTQIASSKEIKDLTGALWRTSLAANADRYRFETRLHDLMERRILGL